MAKPKLELAECQDKDRFMQALRGVYEKSEWVAQRAFGPAFESVTDLAAALAAVVDGAPEAERVALLRAHPDLAGKAALAKELTAESNYEQARAGLGSLTADELKQFGDLNAAYRARFDWPFILAVRNASKRAILAAFQRRLTNGREAELVECIAQVHKIAWLRVLDAVRHAPMGKLTCHVLDTAHGAPAAGMAVELHALVDGVSTKCLEFVTNADGRLDGPALSGAGLFAGSYEWRFRVGDYFVGRGAPTHATPFLDVVPIRFGIDNPEKHYHVPLLCSPWSFSTYRGS
ncbi:OHCU decarboxylase-domain-containing protein [Pelagophyceae sp. CCMP2097]|nr:OHCU decarboxylase-domain-containing protein [Pelagophyceae sp. CCMP2097]